MAITFDSMSSELKFLYVSGLVASVIFGLLPVHTLFLFISKKNTTGISWPNMLFSTVNFILWSIYSWNGPVASFSVNLFCCVANMACILVTIVFSSGTNRRNFIVLAVGLIVSMEFITSCSVSYVGTLEIRHDQMGLLAQTYNVSLNMALGIHLLCKGVNKNWYFCVSAAVLLLRSGAWVGYAWLLGDSFLFKAHASGAALSVLQLIWYSKAP